MSNTTIEREIVQMVFEAKDFRKGISDSINDIGDLQKSFKMDNAQRSLADLQKASNIDFNVMAEGISSINNKMSAMGVAAAAVIANIANSIISSGRSIADALIFAPLSQGMEEYEIQLNAIQTILANTKKQGTTMGDVTAALGELNEYADLTIYNFAEMTKNIGTFTTAGVDLDTSVAAIKGIANAAAMSGANAQQAASAMYQLSQAVSSGVVRLQDWMSVEKAGIGGEIFKQSLMETARVHGVAVDKFIEDNGSFRNSLSENWLSSDILLETLSKFTGDLTEAQLLSIGYTEEQIVGILELGEMANEAATKIKTLTAFKDTMAEALGSGWAQSWAIILGDFEEAKVLWGSLEDFFGTFIRATTDARNKMLSFWAAAGGRAQAIEGIFNVLQAVANILGAVKEAFEDIFPPVTAGTLLVLTKRFLDFSEKLKAGSESLEGFKSIVRGIAAALDIVRLVISAVLSPLKALIPGLSEAGGGFFEWLANLGDTIVAFREFAIETKFFDNIVADVIAKVKELVATIKDLVNRFLDLDVVKDIVEYFNDLERADFVSLWKNILDVVKLLVTPFYLLGIAAKNLYEEIAKLEIIKKISEYFQDISWEGIKKSFVGIGEGIQDIVDEVKNSELVGKFMELLETFDGRRIKQFFADAKEGFSWLPDSIGKVKEALGGLLSGVGGTEAIASGLGDITKTIGDGLGTVLDYLTENAGNIDYSQLFDIINKGLLAGVLVSIRNVLKGGLFGGLLGEDLGEGISDVVEGLGDTLGTFQNNIRADTLQKIAVAIALLAGSIMLMTLIDSTKLATATGAMVLMLTALFGAAGAMRLINAKDAMKASAVIVGLSVALTIASLALKNVSGIDPKRMEDSLLAMGAGLAALVLSVNALGGKGGGMQVLKTIAILLGLTVALDILAVTIRKFGEMDPDTIAKGVAGVGASLAMLVASIAIISKAGSKGMLKAALGITVMSGALIVMSISVKKFGEMDVDTLQQGLVSIGIILLGFAGFSRLLDSKGMLSTALGITVMSGALLIMEQAVRGFADISWDEMIRGLVGMGAALLILVIAANLMSGALAGAAAMLVMSVAVLAIAGALKLLSSLSWEELGIALVGLAATFVILGLAGLILGPVIPVLLGLGIAMLLIGAGAALIGLGLLLASIGLVAIAGSAALIAAAIGIVGAAIIEILPKLAEAIAQALVNFLTVIAENTPIIIEAMRVIILGMITMVASLIPDIVIVVMDMISAILAAIVERLPDLVQQGWDILLAFLQGIEDNIGDVTATVLIIVTEFLDEIAANISDIVAAGLEILTEFLSGISDNIQDVIDAGFDIVTEFMEGIGKGIPLLIDQAGETILEILNGIEAGVDKYMAEIIAAGVRIGVAVVEGLVNGIVAGYGDIKTAVLDMARKALDALGLGFLMDSPSKATWAIAKQVVLGFVNGIKDNLNKVDEGFREFREKLQTHIDPLIQGIADEFDKSVVLEPVIRPVLDLDNIAAGVGVLNRSFDNSRVLAALSYSGQLTTEKTSATGTGVNGDGEQVTFIQNNYSPKALDRETIYRQTRTQVAKLSVRAFE